MLPRDRKTSECIHQLSVKFKEGSFLRYDITTEYNGYWSSAGRTVFVGTPDGQIRKAYEKNIELKNRAIEFLKPGICCKDLFDKAKQFSSKEHIPFFESPGIGYGLGTSEREAPLINPHDQTIIQPGMILALDIITFGLLMS